LPDSFTAVRSARADYPEGGAGGDSAMGQNEWAHIARAVEIMYVAEGAISTGARAVARDRQPDTGERFDVPIGRHRGIASNELVSIRGG
jgi:hypothetical protein